MLMLCQCTPYIPTACQPGWSSLSEQVSMILFASKNTLLNVAVSWGAGAVAGSFGRSPGWNLSRMTIAMVQVPGAVVRASLDSQSGGKARTHRLCIVSGYGSYDELYEERLRRSETRISRAGVCESPRCIAFQQRRCSWRSTSGHRAAILGRLNR